MIRVRMLSVPLLVLEPRRMTNAQPAVVEQSKVNQGQPRRSVMQAVQKDRVLNYEKLLWY